MGSLFGGRRSGKSKSNTPRYATREEVIALFLKYYNTTPDEEGIRANMGNPGGVDAIEKMLKDSLAPQEPITIVTTIGPMSRQFDFKVIPRTMAYWRQINQHYLNSYLTFFVSVNRKLMLIDVDKTTLASRKARYFGDFEHEGEGCYFSAITPHHLFIPIGSELRRYDIRDSSYETVMQVNGQCWQPHTSYYETHHSCSVKRDGQIVKWAVNGNEYFLKGNPDECQIDKSGDWLLCKETFDDERGESNRIIHIPTGAERIIFNKQGAVGHSDCGFGLVYGENDQSNFGGALDQITFETGSKGNVYHTDVWNMGYFSYSNAKPARNTFGLLSSSDGRLIKIDLERNYGQGTVIANVNTHAINYDRRVKANVCPEGQFAAFIDADFNPWIVRIP